MGAAELPTVLLERYEGIYMTMHVGRFMDRGTEVASVSIGTDGSVHVHTNGSSYRVTAKAMIESIYPDRASFLEAKG